MSWRCDRLNVTTMQKPCKANKFRGVFACDRCPGAVPIEEILKSEEKIEMAKSLAEQLKEQKEKRIAERTKKDVWEEENPPIVEPPAHIAAAEILYINILAVIRERKQAALDAEMLEINNRLHELVTDQERLNYVFSNWM